MTSSENPEAPESAAPPVVSAFISEFVCKCEDQYALLGQGSKITLFYFQMELLIFGLHCLDRAVLAHWGDEYRSVFMDAAFSFAWHMMMDVLPESERERFADGFARHLNGRQNEYSSMKVLNKDSEGLKDVLAYEVAKRLCLEADVYNPVGQLGLLLWLTEIQTMMFVNIAPSL